MTEVQLFLALLMVCLIAMAVMQGAILSEVRATKALLQRSRPTGRRVTQSQDQGLGRTGLVSAETDSE